MIKVYLCDEISPISATVIDPKLNLSISFRNKKPAESRGAAPCRIIEQGNNEIWEGDIKRGMIQYVNNSQITEVQIQGNRGNLNIVFFLQNFCPWIVEYGKREKVQGVDVRISQLAGNWKVRNSNSPKENALWTEFNFLQIHKSCNGNNYLQASNVNSWQLLEILSQEQWIAACIEVQNNWFDCGPR